MFTDSLVVQPGLCQWTTPVERWREQHPPSLLHSHLFAYSTTDKRFAEHVQLFLSSASEDRFDKTILHYKDSLRAIFDKDPSDIGAIQTSTTLKGLALTSLTPNYLCLQCSAITTTAGRIGHGNETLHRFCKSATQGKVPPSRANFA